MSAAKKLCRHGVTQEEIELRAKGLLPGLPPVHSRPRFEVLLGDALEQEALVSEREEFEQNGATEREQVVQFSLEDEEIAKTMLVISENRSHQFEPRHHNGRTILSRREEDLLAHHADEMNETEE